MFVIIHVLLGSLIGIHLNSISLIILLALLSHFLLDIIPHWDSSFDKQHFKNFSEIKFNKINVSITIVDVLFAGILISFLYYEFHSRLLILGAIFSLLPDAAKLGYFTRLKEKNKYRKYLHFHSMIQRETSLIFGLFTQLVILILLIILL